MASRHILAIDQGTTNTKVIAVDDGGGIVASASRPVSIAFPQPGWVEQEPAALWSSVREAIADVLAQLGPRRIDAIAVTNQRESVLAWDRRTGEPVGPCIVWQCRRTAPFCADLRALGVADEIEQITGLTLDPLFSASKIRWLLDHVPDGHARAAAGDLCAGTVDSWVLWNLTGGAVHACDATNASRTQLYNLRTGTWDPALLERFGVPRAVLPEIKPSSGLFGHTIRQGPLSAEIPITGVIGDSHGALFGHAAFAPGVVKATYGTGSSLMSPIPAPARSTHGLSTTVAWAIGAHRQFALEGNITVTGGGVDWFGQFLGGTSPAAVAEMAASVPDSGGVYVVPAFAGLGAPYWDDQARGVICGLTRGTTAAHVARATLDAIAFQVRDVFDAMQEDAAQSLTSLLADGGASRNDRLMQIQADTLGCAVVRNRSTDLSACGAAWLAGLAAGIWPSTDALAALPRSQDRFEPLHDPASRDAQYAGWRDAVERARGRAPFTEAGR